MKILIDFTQIPKKKVGVGVYAYNLVRFLAKIDKKNQYLVLIQDDDDCFDEIINTVTLIKVKSRIFRKFFFRIFLEQIYIPFLILRHKIDIIHSLHYSFPLITFNAKKVVTVHDMTFFLFPHFHIPIKRVYFRFFIFLSSKLADGIITVSKSTLMDYVKRFNFRKDYIFVVYHGVDERFSSDIDKKKIEKVKNKYNINNEYLLYVGTLEPRKNIKNIILAFNMLVERKSSDLLLVIAGKKGWYYEEIFKLVDELKLKEKILFIGFVDEVEKPYLFAGAKIFLYPSFYEGFGIPILEALSCGLPTITSNISSIPEIVEDSAILINPNKVEELYDSIVLLLENKKLYNSLKLRSIKQAKKFSWKLAAKNTVNIYEKLS